MNLIKLLSFGLPPMRITMSIGLGMVAALAGGSIVSGLLGSKGSKRAARIQAAASREATAETRRQFDVTQQNLQPWMRAATGDPIYDTEGKVTGYTGGALNQYKDYGRSQVDPNSYIPDSNIPNYQDYVNNLPAIQNNIPQFDVQGNLQQYTDQGNVQGLNVDSNIQDFNVQGNLQQYTDQGNIQDFNVRGDVPQFNVQGDIPKFDSTQFDIYKDPSYEFRQAEQERGINRAAAGQGKVFSGNRLEEIMKRSGQLASTEYGAARNRMVQDYQIQRQNEAAGYGRDVTAYEANRQNEATGYGRNVTAYQANQQNEAQRYGRGRGVYDVGAQRERDQYGRDISAFGAQNQIEQQRYGRGLTQFQADTAREATQYGRGRGVYDVGAQRERDQYGRDITAYDVGRQNEAQRYGRGVDQYGRSLALGEAGYKAQAGQEQLGYNRGIGNFGRAYGQETDYLNRLASISNFGRQTATDVGRFGANASNQIGANINAAGQASGAAAIGSANAWQRAIGDITSLGTQYYGGQGSRGYVTDYNPTNTPYMRGING